MAMGTNDLFPWDPSFAGERDPADWKIWFGKHKGVRYGDLAHIDGGNSWRCWALHSPAAQENRWHESFVELERQYHEEYPVDPRDLRMPERCGFKGMSASICFRSQKRTNWLTHENKQHCRWYWEVIDLQFQLNRWINENPARGRAYRRRRTDGVFRNVGAALGPWDDKARDGEQDEDEYDSDDSFIAPEYSDGEDHEVDADNVSESAATSDQDEQSFINDDTSSAHETISESESSSEHRRSSSDEETAEFTEQDSDWAEPPPNTQLQESDHSDEDSDTATVLNTPKKKAKTVTVISSDSDASSDSELADIKNIRKKTKSPSKSPTKEWALSRIQFAQSQSRPLELSPSRKLSPPNKASTPKNSSPPKKSSTPKSSQSSGAGSSTVVSPRIRKRQIVSDSEDDVPIPQLFSPAKKRPTSLSPKKKVRTYIGKPLP